MSCRDFVQTGAAELNIWKLGFLVNGVRLIMAVLSDLISLGSGLFDCVSPVRSVKNLSAKEA